MFVPFYPPHTGGVEYYAEDLAQNLAQFHCTLSILTPHIPNTVEYNQHKNTQIIPYPAFEIVHNYPLPKFWKCQFWKILNNQRRAHPDIIITHTRFFFSSFLGALFSLFTGTPHIHIEHGSSFVQSDNPFIASVAWIFDHSIGKCILHRAQSVVAVSESVKNFIKRFSKKSKISVIYRGFKTEKIASIATNSDFWKPHASKLKIVFIGRLVSSKGVHELISALSMLPAQNWVCVFIGDGKEEESLKERVHLLKKEDAISFVGSKPWNETLGILKGADIFINPSYTEGLPTTVLEAALCGIPTIATDVGGTSEISSLITLIPTKNPDCITDAIIEVSGRIAKEKSACKEQIREIQAKFSWQTATQKFLNILESLHP